jgi:hypothetical protein
MKKCASCGGKLRRVHRTFWERFHFLAIYECVECDIEQCLPRPWRYHFGPQALCPRCGNARLTRLKERDQIDPMQGGLWNLFKRLAGGKLAHCRFCRLQFYDRRPIDAGTTVPDRQEVDARTS